MISAQIFDTLLQDNLHWQIRWHGNDVLELIDHLQRQEYTYLNNIATQLTAVYWLCNGSNGLVVEFGREKTEVMYIDLITGYNGITYELYNEIMALPWDCGEMGFDGIWAGDQQENPKPVDGVKRLRIWWD